ncbi:MAG TPA: vitamin K epoxide reductase family protein [Streptosporangiaceae bacterium]
MAGSKARAARSRTQSRDKGTRGGRPEPQVTGKAVAPARSARTGSPARAGNSAQAGSPARPGNGPAGRPAQPGQRGTVTVPAGPGVRPVPTWLQLTTWALATAGLGVSIYLTVAHYTSSSILACSDKGLVNCAAVTTSPESIVFGIFPVAVLGLAFYVFLFAVTSPWAWRWNWPPVRLARLGSLVVGMLFVLYLIYTELITLNAICLWCTSVHVLTFALFALVVFAFAAGYGTPEPSARR